MSIIPYLSSREISQAQSNIQSGITPLTLLLNLFIWGIPYLLTPSALANSVKTLSSEPTETRSTKVTTLFESQAVRGSLINPVSSAPMASTVVSPASIEKSIPLQGKASDFHLGQLDRLQTKTWGELAWSDANSLKPTGLSQRPILKGTLALEHVTDANSLKPTGLSQHQSILTLPTQTTEAEPTPMPRASWEVSQTTVIPDAASEPPANSSSPKEPQTAASQPTRWHFLFQPYLYLPVTIYGTSTIDNSESTRTFTRDIDIDADQIKTTIQDDLNFAFFGNLQAWAPNYHWGLLADVNYLSASSQGTLTRPVRRAGLADFIPTQLQADLDAQVWSVDLAATYRFYNPAQVNPKGVFTEFDLGPFVFDIIGGLNITSVNTNLDLSTNLGGQAEFDAGATVVSPLLGGRFRWNASPKLALVTTGSVSGFGIAGLTNWGVVTNLDWMFSGNTSLGLGYRFGYVSYNKNADSGRDFGVNLNNNGPFLSLTFRF